MSSARRAAIACLRKGLELHLVAELVVELLHFVAGQHIRAQGVPPLSA